MFPSIEYYHNIVIHFPIALYITGYLFDCFGFFKKNLMFSKFGFWNLCLAIFWSVLSIITGFITDNQVFGHMSKPFPIWSTHGTHMIVAVLLFILMLVLRILLLKKKINLPYVTLLFFHGIALIFFIHGAHIGAMLTK